MPGAAQLDEVALLAQLPALAFAFVLVFSRVGAAVMLLPGMGEMEVPPMVRAGLALALTVLLLPIVQPKLPAEPAGAAALAVLVGGELLVGGWIGWLARLATWACGMAGQVVSFMLGLSNVLVPDATLGGQSTALERLFNMAAVLVLLGTGLHAVLLRALAGSYAVLAPGGGLPVGDGLESVVAALADSFALAARLAAPFILLGTAWQVALGLLARLVPRLQVYFIAMPGQILGGFLLLGLLAGAMLAAWRDGAEQALARLPGLN